MIYTKDAHVHFIKKNKKKNMRRSTPDFYSNLKFYTIYHIKSASIFHHFIPIIFYTIINMCLLLLYLLNINRSNDHTIPYIF